MSNIAIHISSCGCRNATLRNIEHARIGLLIAPLMINRGGLETRFVNHLLLENSSLVRVSPDLDRSVIRGKAPQLCLDGSIP
jgi:hypothetical protein